MILIVEKVLDRIIELHNLLKDTEDVIRILRSPFDRRLISVMRYEPSVCLVVAWRTSPDFWPEADDTVSLLKYPATLVLVEKNDRGYIIETSRKIEKRLSEAAVRQKLFELARESLVRFSPE